MPRSREWMASLLLLACACGASAGTAGGTLRPDRESRRGDVLFAQDLVASRANNVYEAILEVRPSFLRARGRAATADASRRLRVFLDNLELSGLDALRSVPLGPVTSVRFIDAGDFAFRWGGTGAAGAILVTTAR